MDFCCCLKVLDEIFKLKEVVEKFLFVFNNREIVYDEECLKKKCCYFLNCCFESLLRGNWVVFWFL